MPLPPVHIVSQTEYFVSGDVSIDETAVVAPGVILQAAPNSQIRIAGGVCIGMGTVLNAYAGIISIESGATLGPGVLIIGRCSVGEGACVGTTTTIINSLVEAFSLIPAGSLLGDTSRGWDTQPELIPEKNLETIKDSSRENLPSPWDTEEEVKKPEPEPVVRQSSTTDIPKEKGENKSDPITETISEIPIFTEPRPPVVGQVYINQLLITLFPERRHFKVE